MPGKVKVKRKPASPSGGPTDSSEAPLSSTIPRERHFVRSPRPGQSAPPGAGGDPDEDDMAWPEPTEERPGGKGGRLPKEKKGEGDEGQGPAKDGGGGVPEASYRRRHRTILIADLAVFLVLLVVSASVAYVHVAAPGGGEGTAPPGVGEHAAVTLYAFLSTTVEYTSYTGPDNVTLEYRNWTAGALIGEDVHLRSSATEPDTDSLAAGLEFWLYDGLDGLLDGYGFGLDVERNGEAVFHTGTLGSGEAGDGSANVRLEGRGVGVITVTLMLAEVGT